MQRIPILLVVPLLAAGASLALYAQDNSAARTSGKVLILHNERTFEGDTEKVGEFYHVHRAGGEIVVAGSQVLRLCADWDDAVAYMRSRANLDDPDERLRLAKWLQVNHQVKRAMVEAQYALEMRPKHGETKQLVKLLEMTPANSPKRTTDPHVQPVPHIDLSFESVMGFTQKVQPILMNTCISCHSGGYHGEFKLYRPYEGGERMAMQRNLAAVIDQLRLEKPATSPLLVMAVCAHGEAKSAPVPGRQSPTFQTLCAWIDQTIADNPHLLERQADRPTPAAGGAARTPALTAPPARKMGLPPLPGVIAAQTAPTSDGSPPPPIVLPTSRSPSSAPLSAPPVEPPDDFSPAHFNRAYHPNRK
jgi:hypothetical protein